MGLLCGVICVILRLAVLIQYWSVTYTHTHTNTQTDRHTTTAYTALSIGRVSYISIYLCYFCFRWKTVSLVQASMQHLMHHVTVSLQQSKITLQNNCINNTSITQAYTPNMNCLLTTKMWKATKNAKIGVLWWVRGHPRLSETSRFCRGWKMKGSHSLRQWLLTGLHNCAACDETWHVMALK